MKAILRSINNFSCKLKQSNNLKYNISPKITSNKFKNISGNGSLVIEDALSKSVKDYKIYGNTYQNSTRGTNISPSDIDSWVSGQYQTSGGIQTMPSRIRLKELLPVNPNTTYYFDTFDTTNTNITHAFIIRECDINGTFIKNVGIVNNKNTITTGANTYYLMVTIGSNAISTGEDFTNYETYFSEGTLKPFICLNSAESKEFEPYTNGASPNPDYPQEIISCGDRTKNLIPTNVNDWEQGTISQSGTNQESTTRIRTIDYYKINNDMDYYVSIENENYTFLNIMLYDYQKQLIGQYYTINQEINGTRGLKINIASLSIPNVKYCRVILRRSDASIITPEETSIIKPMIASGDTKLNFEPYGYKIPINIKSDNLFDINNNPFLSNGVTMEGNYILCNYNNTSSSRVERFFNTDNLELKPGTEYLCVAEIIEVSGTGTFRPITRWAAQNKGQFNYDEAGFPFSELIAGQKILFTATTYPNLEQKIEGLRTIFLFQPGESGSIKVRISILADTTIAENNFKYQPYYNRTTNIYLDEPLRKIDGYSDYIDYVNGKVVRKIYEYKITGNENWQKQYGINLFDVQSLFNDNPFINGYGLSNMYKYNPIQSGIDTNTVHGEFALQRSTRGTTRSWSLFIKNTSYSDKDLFKTYLQNLYNNNTPVIINYPLETPTEEDIELPNINLIEGKNIITIGTELESIIEVEYYSKEIIDISDYKYNLRKVED